MAIKDPPFSVDDQEYYPLHEEDDVPEIPPHRRQVRYADGSLSAHFPAWFVSGNACIYWERGNTRDFRAPDLFVVKEPLTEPVTRVYQLWKQPPIAFVMEVGSRTAFRQDVGPKVGLYQQKIRAAEYGHLDMDHETQRLWRLGPDGYEEVAPRPTGRFRSVELGLEFGLDAECFLRFYKLDGEMLLTHEEELQRREEAERRCLQAEGERDAEARGRQKAEQQREAEARGRREAEERAAELERRLAELQARLSEHGSGDDP